MYMNKKVWLSLAVAPLTGMSSLEAASPDGRPNIILFFGLAGYFGSVLESAHGFER